MRETLQKIKKQQKNNGAATAPKINTYKDSSSLYKCLDKLEKTQMIKKQKAPTTVNINHTYTITDFGEKFLEKTRPITTQQLQKK